MRNLERRIANLERAINPPRDPLVVWKGSQAHREAEAAGREVIVVRWLREGEATRVAYYGQA